MREFIRFLIVGCINTGITYILFFLISPVLGYKIAYTGVFIVGIGISYFLNSKIVFKVAPRLKSTLLYPGVYLAQYIWGIAVLMILVDHWGWDRNIALLVVIGSSIPLTFLLSRKVFS
jgi:putative flippase GtrA